MTRLKSYTSAPRFIDPKQVKLRTTRVADRKEPVDMYPHYKFSHFQRLILLTLTRPETQELTVGGLTKVLTALIDTRITFIAVREHCKKLYIAGYLTDKTKRVYNPETKQTAISKTKFLVTAKGLALLEELRENEIKLLTGGTR